jgi:enterochelin esterase-like enzyme
MRTTAVSALALVASTLRAQELAPVPGAEVPTLAWESEVRTIASEALGEELRLFIGKPPSFARAQRPLPVLYLLDGQYYFAEVQAVLANLAGYGHVPEMLLVGIESRDRRKDFTPSGIYLPDVEEAARADLYLDFLEHELAPAVERELRGGKPRVVLGHSHAALLVLHALAQRPQAFPWGIAVDAPTHHDDGFIAHELERMLCTSERPPVRVGSEKVVFGWSDEQWETLQRAARPGDLLTHHVLAGESHESMLFPATYHGLHALFADASMQRMRKLAPLEIDALYRALAHAYGTAVEPPEPLMRQVVEDFLMEGRGKHAGEWLARYTATYGAPPDDAALRAQVAEVTALGDPPETVAELLALPRATPEEMKDHLGTWKGATRRGETRRTGLTVVFHVTDGVVGGEVRHDEGGPAMALEYVRFRADGALEFGYRNGMRPRGLILYTETVPGGPLEGTIPFRGIRFTPPDGHAFPEGRFELRRIE